MVELGLDPTKFKKGQTEAVESLRKFEQDAKKHVGGVGTAVKGAESDFAFLQKRLLGVAGLLLGGLGIEQFIQKVTRLQVATANLGQVFGLSSQSLQQWAAAGERVGVAGSSVQQGMAEIQRQQYSLRNFGDPGGLLKMQWGTAGTKNPLQVTSPNGEMLSAEQIAMNIAKWLQKTGPQGANALMQMGGLSQEFVTFLMQGPEKIKKLLEDTKKLAPSDKDIKSFKDLNEAFAKAAQQAEAAGRKIVVELVPALIKLLETAAKVTEFIAHPFGKSDEQIVEQLNRQRPGGAASLEEAIRRKESEVKSNEDRLRDAKGIYRRPLEDEQRKLVEELRKLRETLEKERSTPSLQNQSFFGSVGGGKIIPAMYSGGPGGNGGIPGATGGSANRSAIPGPGNGAGVAGSMPKGKQDVARAATDEMRAAGLSDAAIAGIFANVQDESSFNPTLRHPDQPKFSGEAHYAHGLFQEGGTEWNRYAAWLGKYHSGADWKDPRLQTRFLMENLKENYPKLWERLKGASKEDAARAFVQQYLKPRRDLMIGRSNKYGRGVPGIGHYGIEDLPDAARKASPGGGGPTSSNSSHMTVGDVHVHTQATDAAGIASDIKPQIERFARVMNSNFGPA